MIQRCLTIDDTRRIDLNEFYNHPFLQGSEIPEPINKEINVDYEEIEENI